MRVIAPAGDVIDPPWRIELFGGLRVSRGDHRLTRFRTRKAELLLAYLAYSLSRSHPREVLTDLLWPESDLPAGRSNLSRELSALRHQLELPGGVVLADRTTVQLNPDAVTTDVEEFDAVLRAAAGADRGADRIPLLARAVDLYRGELLYGYYAEWVLQERHGLAERYFQALSQLVAHLESVGDLARAIDYARRAVRDDPLREEAHRDLISLLAATGEPAAAQRQYRELERLLREELGDTPTAATRAILDQLAARQPPLPRRPAADVGAARPARSPGRPHLPLQLTRFFGREQEIARLTRWLLGGDGLSSVPLETPHTGPSGVRPRLVTLTGPAGSGKSRLALEVAERVAPGWEGAVWFIPLADLAEARLIPAAVRDAMALPRLPSGEPLDQVVVALADRPALLLLDNFEHLVSGGAPLVRRLLERVPLLTCLVTSRRRLLLAGEHEFHVFPLPTPSHSEGLEELSQCASVQLFLDRARSVSPEFWAGGAEGEPWRPGPANAAAIAELCRRLEGIPLALELAAARSAVVAPAQMLAYLEPSLSPSPGGEPPGARRFEFLVTRQRDVAARHRTLRAALDWSYELLPAELQRFFARLSVFRGGWTAAAAQAVCDEVAATSTADDRPQTAGELAPPAVGEPPTVSGSVLEYLEQLRECSMLLVEETPGGKRFRMLETLREYGAARFSREERAALAERHARYYLQQAEEADRDGTVQRFGHWLDRVEVERENVRAALDWFEVSGQAWAGLRLAGALYRFWWTRGYLTESRQRLARLLALPEAGVPTEDRARALGWAGQWAFGQGNVPAARAFHEEALAIRRSLGDRRNVGWSIHELGKVARVQGEYEAARRFLEEGLRIFQGLDDRWGIACSLDERGILAWYLAEYRTARACHVQSEEIWRELGHELAAVQSRLHLADVALVQGHAGEAQALFGEVLKVKQATSDPRGVAGVLGSLVLVACSQGEYKAAQSLAEQSLALFRQVGDRDSVAQLLVSLARVALAQGDHETAQRSLVESLGIMEAVGDRWGTAAVLHGLARVRQAQGEHADARALFAQSLAQRRALPDERGTAECLEGCAGLAGTEGQSERAARWLGAAAAIRKRLGAPRPLNEQPAAAEQCARLRAALGDAGYAAALAAGHALGWEEAAAEAVAEMTNPALLVDVGHTVIRPTI